MKTKLKIRDFNNAWRKGIYDIDKSSLKWENLLEVFINLLKGNSQSNYMFDGLGTTLGKKQILLFCTEKDLFLQVDKERILLNESISIKIEEQTSKVRLLVVLRNGIEIVSISYKIKTDKFIEVNDYTSASKDDFNFPKYLKKVVDGKVKPRFLAKRIKRREGL